MTTSDVTPKLYLADLAAYNDGKLHGAWVQLDDTDWETNRAAFDETLAKVLATSPCAGAEEYAVHDHEGFGPYKVSEYPNVDELCTIAAGIAEHGAAYAAFASVADDHGIDLDDPDAFGDHYRGEWGTFADFAEEFFDDVYHEVVKAAEANAYLTVDYDAFARDLRCDYTTADAGDGNVWVFEDDV